MKTLIHQTRFLSLLLILLTAQAAAQHTATPTALNDFACGLYREAGKADPGGNLFFSPYSAFTALTILLEGAEAETRGEMARALSVPEELARATDPLHAGLADIARRLAGAPLSPHERERLARLEEQMRPARRLLDFFSERPYLDPPQRVMQAAREREDFKAQEERWSEQMESWKEAMEEWKETMERWEKQALEGRVTTTPPGPPVAPVRPLEPPLRPGESLAADWLAAGGAADWPPEDLTLRNLAAHTDATVREVNSLRRRLDPWEFRSANALWVDRRFTLGQPFLDAVSRHHGPDLVSTVDFEGDAEAARQEINRWVGEQTAGRIPELLRPPISPRTALIITNAVYFLGEWVKPFPATRTEKAPFHPAVGESVEVPMMQARGLTFGAYAAFARDGAFFPTPQRIAIDQRDESGFYPADGFQLLQLNYKGETLSMWILLPLGENTLGDIETMLNSRRLWEWAAHLEARGVHVYLPRFKLRETLDLGKVLQRMGMERAFLDPGIHPSGAQFGRLQARTNPPQDPLFVSAVLHEAFVEVNEKGTEAAAATAVGGEFAISIPRDRPFIPTFRADRPFLFLIRDNESGAILFMGRYARP